MHIKESKLGGLILSLAALLLLITIFFELQVGWIGVERPEKDVPMFIYNQWANMKLIWSWQALAQALFVVAYLLLLKDAQGIKSLIWSIFILAGTMITVGMLLTLGSYFTALEVYDENPVLFQSIRGAVRALYLPGIQTMFLFFLLIFGWELFGKEGVIHKKTGLVIIGLVMGIILIGSFAGLSLKVTGAAFFFLPVVLGYFYWKKPT